jgi:DNA-binding NarL/FixJ family response regulator
MENSTYRIMIRVGLIDDHALIRKGFTIMLEQLGYMVIIEASHGKDFIHQISEKNQPDIILLDTKLYVMDSYSTLQWIKINYPQIPVIALHSKNDEESLDKLMKGGAAGYIYKTSTPQEVNRLIKEVLGSSRYFTI